VEPLERDTRNYAGRAIDGLLAAGWQIAALPDNRRLLSNRQVVRLEGLGRPTLVRLSIYKVGESGRGSSHERRVEVTTTYGANLAPDPALVDVVLGYEPAGDVFVGLDPRRLAHGGATQNASSFIEALGLAYAQQQDRLVVLDRKSRLLGIEYQAFFPPHLLAEYIVNAPEIHGGAYPGGGPFSGARATSAQQLEGPPHAFDPTALVLTAPSVPAPRAVANSIVERAAATGYLPRKTSPEELEQILRRQAITGALGELVALESERRRLLNAGQTGLAAAVTQVSCEDVTLGYDIRSFEDDGVDRFVEVKSTTGTTRRFEMSANEWRTASRLGALYVIARVTRVRTPTPAIAELRDPTQLLRSGNLTQTPTGYRIGY
jgi:hypothetical protein